MTDSYTGTGEILQVNGENSGTWGTKTNTNWLISTLLAGGNVTEDMSSGDVTVPNVDGVADDGKKTVFITIGTLTSAVNLILPTRARVYIVTNNCTGAFTMTAKTVAGTGVIIPQGGSLLLYCDGTNIVEAVNTIGLGGTTGAGGGIYMNNTIASSGTSQALDWATYQSYFITLTSNCSLTFSANPTSGSNLNIVQLTLQQDTTGGWTPSFPASVLWAGTGNPLAAPTLGGGAGTYTLIELRTKDNGVTWIATVLGTGGSANVPVAGLYLTAGATSKANRSTDGLTFSAANPSFAGMPLINDVIYNTVYNKFHLIALRPTTPDTGASTVLSTADGTSYNTPSVGVLNCIPPANAAPTVPFIKWHLFSNGNVITGQPNAGALAISTDGGVSIQETGQLVRDGAALPGWVGTANAGLLVSQNLPLSTYTLDGGVTFQTVTHTGITDSNMSAYCNGNYIIGGMTGNAGYKTLISSATLTPITPNLASSNVLGAIFSTNNYVIWTSASVSTSSSVNGTYTSRTAAFFTAAGMAGNIVNMATNTAQTILMAVTDTGDVGRSTDGGITWNKLSAPNNPLSGIQITGITFTATAFWIFGNAGKLATSPDGSAFSVRNTAGFGASSITAFASR